jgi:hypothetical protein
MPNYSKCIAILIKHYTSNFFAHLLTHIAFDLNEDKSSPRDKPWFPENWQMFLSFASEWQGPLLEDLDEDKCSPKDKPLFPESWQNIPQYGLWMAGPTVRRSGRGFGGSPSSLGCRAGVSPWNICILVCICWDISPWQDKITDDRIRWQDKMTG